MNVRKVAALCFVLSCCIAVAVAKPKKPEVSAIFQNARFVFVESMDGDAYRPGLFPEDRQAIFDVQDSLRDWNRYVITDRRADADLIFVVRKGRLAAAQARGGISGGPRVQPGQTQQSQFPGQGDADQGRDRSNDGAMVGARGEVGPADDVLRVFAKTGEGKLMGPIWIRELDGGLDAPSVQLVKQLKFEVEKAYPQSQPAQPSKP